MPQTRPFVVRGHEGTLQYATDFDSPSWTEVEGVMDVKDNLEFSEGDGTTRDGGGYEAVFPTVTVIGLEFSVLRKKSSTEQPQATLRALIDYAIAQTPIVWRSLDGDPSADNCEGPKFWGHIMGIPREQPVKDGIKYTFTVKPAALADDAPTWEKVTQA